MDTRIEFRIIQEVDKFDFEDAPFGNRKHKLTLLQQIGAPSTVDIAIALGQAQANISKPIRDGNVMSIYDHYLYIQKKMTLELGRRVLELPWKTIDGGGVVEVLAPNTSR